MSKHHDVKEILLSAGWLEGRKIDTSSIEKLYKECGVEVFPKVLSFFEEFGMLNLIVKEQNGRVDCHNTNPLPMLDPQYYDHGQFKAEENYAGEKLVPVGECCNRNLVLFVSESGKIYHSTGKCGDTPWEAWESLINKTSLVGWSTLQKERRSKNET